MVSILLLLVAAIVVMVSVSKGNAEVEQVLRSSTDTTHAAIPPAMRAVTPSGGVQQADRAIQDMETANELMQGVINDASATPLGQ
jgi:guanyl-specific ribonuclease Sa